MVKGCGGLVGGSKFKSHGENFTYKNKNKNKLWLLFFSMNQTLLKMRRNFYFSWYIA